MGEIMSDRFECPWCGNTFSSGRELDIHARKHYAEATPS